MKFNRITDKIDILLKPEERRWSVIPLTDEIIIIEPDNTVVAYLKCSNNTLTYLCYKYLEQFRASNSISGLKTLLRYFSMS